MRSNTTESLVDDFRRAFGLAHFIHAEKAVAIEIATAAMAKLEVAATAQVKRLYYRPIRSAASRSKVSLGDLPLLQRLVYIESEPRERLIENSQGARSPDEEELTVHFIKHLVQITVNRNSFHVAVGVSRLLHNYSTAETIRIHDSLLEDPDRAKGEDYCRARKALLMEELKARFGEQITVIRGPRGEERFEAAPATLQSAALAADCFRQFTPWETRCLLPERIDLSRADIPGLSVRSPRDSDGNRNEVNRMHAILHPDCYRRLLAGLRMDPPESRLEIPAFARSGGSERDSRGDRGRPPKLSDDELIAAAAYLAGEAARRRRTTGGLLRILVDGTERSRLDPAVTHTLRIEVEKEAKLIEVRAHERDGEILLATHLLMDNDSPEASQRKRSAIILEAGQEISFAIESVNDPAGEEARLVVDVGYRETNPIRTAALFFQRLRGFARIRPALKPALGFVLVALFAIGLAFWLRASRGREIAPRTGPKSNRTAEKEAATSTTSTAIVSRESRAPVPGTEKRQDLHRPETIIAERLPRRGVAEEEGTRAIQSTSPALTLSSVKKIFVECADRSVREALMRELQASGRFRFVESRDDADAVLHATARRAATDEEQVTVAARLIGPSGGALWPGLKKGSAGRYRGSSEEVATSVLRDLLKAVKRGERNP